MMAINISLSFLSFLRDAVSNKDLDSSIVVTYVRCVDYSVQTV